MGNEQSKNKSGKSTLDKPNIIHPNYTKSGKPAPEIDQKLNNFSIPSQCNTSTSLDHKELWLIRHGERMDEVGSNEAKKWRNKTPETRLFDPPLTKNGFKQATKRGKLLLNELSKYKTESKSNYYPKYIYASPTERTIGSAMSIALILKLPIVIIPGLSTCAAAVQRGGLIKKNINDEEIKDNDNTDIDCELFLRKYGWVGQCTFLTKKEILKKFGKNGVEILFDYQYVDKFIQCVQRLTNESETNIILCVTHREGIRYLDDRLGYSRIPYCALAKFAFVPNSKIHANQFAYFEED